MKIPKDVLVNKGITYNQRYPYGELARVTKDRKRHYETPDGRQVPSVTTVLSATKDMTHLMEWRKKQVTRLPCWSGVSVWVNRKLRGYQPRVPT